MEAGGAIAKMFPWTQIQPQSEPFLLFNAQRPEILLEGKSGTFLMELLVGLSLLVHVNIPYDTITPGGHLQIFHKNRLQANLVS